MKKLPVVALSFAAAALATAHVQDARACGGCFHEPPRPNEVESVITDHRMVFSLSTTQTVLWDQVRYSGNPAEFAWVLPIHPGARIELSHDAFIAALDAITQPVVVPPPVSCPGNGFSNGGSSGGVGCGSSSDTASAFGGGFDDAGSSTPGVTVVRQETVGPYEAVTLRSTMGDSLEAWLTANGFDVPASMVPTLSAYASEGFDFIALKLRPGQSVRAMQPVRVVTDGADPSLPLRMVAAGVGANVGLELYVVAEGRYHTQNFPDAVVDFSKLTWDGVAQRSNFAQLEDDALAANGGRGWITQSSSPVEMYGATTGPSPGLASLYDSLCTPSFTVNPPCDAAAPTDASGDAAEAGSSDAATDAPSHDAAACPPPSKPALCDDITVATNGIRGHVWVTRLRAKLPSQALAVGDLRLEAADQRQVSNQHPTSTYSDPKFDPCPKSNGASTSSSSSGCACNSLGDDGRFGTLLTLGLTAIGVAAMLRRRR